jgi:16S rRNA processing protein RimM
VEADGTARGRCVSVIDNPAADLLELDSGALVPANFVTGVDRVADPIVVTIEAPEGLFELFAEDADQGA